MAPWSSVETAVSGTVGVAGARIVVVVNHGVVVAGAAGAAWEARHWMGMIVAAVGCIAAVAVAVAVVYVTGSSVVSPSPFVGG